ncbi:hypothetical protein OAH36_04475 [Verrucomicrobia bacterium]|nr:hypothetical protein [Verrucomicrobiota bacterium]
MNIDPLHRPDWKSADKQLQLLAIILQSLSRFETRDPEGAIVAMKSAGMFSQNDIIAA